MEPIAKELFVKTLKKISILFHIYSYLWGRNVQCGQEKLCLFTIFTETHPSPSYRCKRYQSFEASECTVTVYVCQSFVQNLEYSGKITLFLMNTLYVKTYK